MCDGTRPFEVTAKACAHPLFGVREVAAFLDVKPRTVNQWVFRRLLPDPDVALHATRLWKRSTLLRWAGDTGRLSRSVLRAEYEMRWKVEPVPYRRGGRIPEPPQHGVRVWPSSPEPTLANQAAGPMAAPGQHPVGRGGDV